MRATISFEIDVNNVHDTMKALAKAQGNNIRAAAHALETGEVHKIEDDLKGALDRLRESVQQLEQYESMLLSFAKAKFETMIPQATTQSVANLGDAVTNLNKFGNFIERLNESSEEPTSGEENDLQPQEG